MTKVPVFLNCTLLLLSLDTSPKDRRCSSTSFSSKKSNVFNETTFEPCSSLLSPAIIVNHISKAIKNTPKQPNRIQ
ncbi:hypothetical protein YC2023_118475 [Brassica napus]